MAFFRTFYQQPQIQHNDFVTLKTKMADENKLCPPFLYKYYNCNKDNLNVLKEDKIWASDPLSFNDPFDCAIQFWRLNNFPRDFVISQLLEIDPRMNHENLATPSLRDKYFKNLLQILGTYCLNDGQNEDIFWGYYCDHNGFLVKYDAKKLIRFWNYPQKIDHVTVEKFYSLRAELSDNKQINNRNLNVWLTTKKKNWIHENEWRFIFRLDENSNDPRKIELPQKSIQEIIIGYKFFEGTDTKYLKKGIYSHTFNSESCDQKGKCHLELLKVLKEKTNFPLRQVALSENFELYHLPIKILEISGNMATIYRQLSEKQIKLMDAEF